MMQDKKIKQKFKREFGASVEEFMESNLSSLSKEVDEQPVDEQES